VTAAGAVLGAWLLFGGAHLLLASPPLRDLLLRRLGERTFVAVYSATAAVTLALLGATVARFGPEGAAGTGLSSSAPARWALGAVSFGGTLLGAAGLLGYFRSPFASLRRSRGPARPLPPPSGVQRVTRHPFFVGLALLMGAHALLASTLAGAVFFGGFVVFVLLGIPLQDRRLRAQYGQVYADYEAATSAVPFAGKSAAGPRLGRTLLLALLGAVLLAALHPLWRLGSGGTFAGAVALGGLYAVARQVQARTTSARG
jgi:uncharacterized membrane protein